MLELGTSAAFVAYPEKTRRHSPQAATAGSADCGTLREPSNTITYSYTRDLYTGRESNKRTGLLTDPSRLNYCQLVFSLIDLSLIYRTRRLGPANGSEEGGNNLPRVDIAFLACQPEIPGPYECCRENDNHLEEEEA
jgi:hypothetical protein